MASLLTEYRKRHKKTFVLPTNEGVCFFDLNGIPAAICLTSLAGRSYSTCYRCAERPCRMIAEVFRPHGHGYHGYNISMHTHIEPDTDILKLVDTQVIGGVVPFMPTSQRDLEFWLWRFFSLNLRSKPLYPKKETMPELSTLEEMVAVAMRQPKSYAVYYAMFELFIIGRKYLIYGGL